MRIKEESLYRALEAAGLQARGLPPRYKEGFWIKAVVLVRKRNMEECYCIYQQNADRYMRLLQDFGNPSPILGVKSIHPYMYLDEKRFMPGGSLDEKRRFLLRSLSDAHVDEADALMVREMSEKDVDAMLLRMGIERQLMQYDEDRRVNLLNEGSDLDGTRYEELERQKYEMELAQMKKDGCSKSEIKAFKEAFEHRNDKGDDDVSDLDDDELIRMQIESAELGEAERKESEVSVEGEFDAPELDLEAIRNATEEWRKEQIKLAKRKWKRAYDGSGDIRAGRVCENEFGEKEAVVTLQMPPKVEMPEEKRKPGRPKNKVKAAATKKRNAANKRAVAKAMKESPNVGEK